MQFTNAIAAAILAYTAVAAPANGVRNVSESCQKQYNECRSAPDANLSTCVSMLDTCDANCEAAYDSCRGGNDANQATCSANLATCSGKLPEKRNTRDSCDKQYDQCRSAPDANLSTCVSNQDTCVDVCVEGMNSCLGGNGPETECYSTFVTCAGHVYTDADAPAETAAAKRNTRDSCDKQYDQCVTAPDANLSTCVSRQDTCNANCQAEADSCRGGNDANQATCSANQAACVGHVVN
ncbi:hypothetical protein F5Y15DRAFT_414742 [Xylariaceae sp. FL0016]|nr:hypothetical protein F5Y15DRAFT_414742 [Xylariaceae sp. FL0016]